MLADLIKIHCLPHGITFPMSRTSRTVVCKEGGEEHTLSSNFPNDGLWVYCCNCQTFIAWDSSRDDATVRECLFCLSSINPRLYSCDHCAVSMVDYDDQTLRKQHMVLSWGMPQPACPGCHHFPSGTPRTHFCEVLKCGVSTARAACIFCGAPAERQAVNGAKPAAPEHGAVLEQAQILAREAEERIRLAEATAQKEIQLRVQAERKAEEIERKATRELFDPREAEVARTRADAEARGREAAEARALESEERLLLAESAALHEAEMRALAEQRARELAATYSAEPPPASIPRRDRVTIALYAALAGVLFFLLLLLIITMISLAGS
ncbi:MAG: cell envelope integrity protein TolA [Blastocatellia bacterium]